MLHSSASLPWKDLVDVARLNASPRHRAWRCLLAMGGLAIALGGCSSTKREFGEVERADAGDTRSDAQTDSSSTGAPISSGDDAGSRCNGADPANGCPSDTECRTYEVSGCDEAGKPVCESRDADAETSCENGAGRCDGDGQCVVPNLARLGESCEENEQCGSGHCVAGQDGQKLCCDAACDGVCTACGNDGHCDVTPTEDAACGELTCPESNECTAYPPNRAACASFGECATAESYCEPEYTTQACGDGLACDGRGNCCPELGPERECTKECPCGTGEGLCSSDEQCLSGYVCTSDATAKLGFPGPSCLPAHCVNDKRDEGETSVDCGGGCGCRASYEVVSVSGVPEGAGFADIKAMSGDGSAFAATIGRDVDGRPFPFPARLSAGGVVTELLGFGAWGEALGVNADGSVIVGKLDCDDPPACETRTGPRPYRWRQDNNPEVIGVFPGTAVAVSATGAIVAGEQPGDEDSGGSMGYRAARTFQNVPEMTAVVAMSGDGEYIAGRSATDERGVLWSATTGVIDIDTPTEWLTWRIEALSDDGQVFVGSARLDNDPTHPFIWRNGTISTFPKLPGAEYNYFRGLSADGSVAVGLSGTNSLQRAFIWDDNNGIRPLVTEARARGVELPVDLELVEANFVSHDGRIIVGRVHSDNTAFWRVTLLPDGEWLP